MLGKWKALSLAAVLAAPWIITGCEDDDIDDAGDAVEEAGDELGDIGD